MRAGVTLHWKQVTPRQRLPLSGKHPLMGVSYVPPWFPTRAMPIWIHTDSSLFARHQISHHPKGSKGAALSIIKEIATLLVIKETQGWLGAPRRDTWDKSCKPPWKHYMVSFTCLLPRFSRDVLQNNPPLTTYPTPPP